MLMLVAWALLATAPRVEARVPLRAIDAVTGIGLRAKAVIRDTEGASRHFQVAPEGAAIILRPGRHEIRVTAAGYRPLAARFHFNGVADPPITFELERELPLRVVTAQAERGLALVHGFVTDASTARPLPGATVVLASGGQRARTGRDGYFRLLTRLPAQPVSLLLSAPGYRALDISGLLLGEGALLLREALEPGRGGMQRDDTPAAALREAPSSHEGAKRQSAPHAADEPWPDAAPAALPSPQDPPDSIRVGTSCSCTTCSAVSVLTLETYVKQGLDDEWIASWNAHSLRAGAVAYRSYGAYYAAHPLNANYDICSTACCQVNDTSTTTATNQAVDRTAGYMLERAGAVFRSEYSAENNAWDDPADGLNCSNADLSCGDGMAGSPATNWSCLADGLDGGHGCFGHGRGMCQWGTQRWASGQGKRWSWIVDHYYNDHGSGSGLRTARLSTPITLEGAAAAVSGIRRGETFTIEATALNRADVAHGRILMGASLDAGTHTISDPAHDALVVLAPGANAISRGFTVPPGSPFGLYDLLVALYDDVDEDGAVTSGDFALQLVRVPDAVRVCRKTRPDGHCREERPSPSPPR